MKSSGGGISAALLTPSATSGSTETCWVRLAEKRLTQGSGAIGSGGSTKIVPADEAMNPTAQPAIACDSRWHALAAAVASGSSGSSAPPSARRLRKRSP